MLLVEMGSFCSVVNAVAMIVEYVLDEIRCFYNAKRIFVSDYFTCAYFSRLPGFMCREAA